MYLTWMPSLRAATGSSARWFAWVACCGSVGDQPELQLRLVSLTSTENSHFHVSCLRARLAHGRVLEAAWRAPNSAAVWSLRKEVVFGGPDGSVFLRFPEGRGCTIAVLAPPGSGVGGAEETPQRDRSTRLAEDLELLEPGLVSEKFCRKVRKRSNGLVGPMRWDACGLRLDDDWSNDCSALPSARRE